MWDPDTYLAFDDHRGRPFFDLVARIDARSPRTVVDVGCGPGNLTAWLATRWPEARITGFDSSPEMVAAAVGRGVAATVADVRSWSPEADVDVVVCNAVLQWVPGHQELLRKWLAQLRFGAWFAFQVPGNFEAASHRVIRELAASARWRDALSGAGLRGGDAVSEPAEYAELALAAGCRADVWETTYQQQLSGPDPVLDWVRGTALRPVASTLSDADFARFCDDLRPLLRAEYPTIAGGGTLFPFRRIFVVAQKPVPEG